MNIISTKPQQDTDTDIAITTAAERIAAVVEQRFDGVSAIFNPANFGAALKTEVIRAALNELWQVDERAYHLGIRHAVIVPEIIPEPDRGVDHAMPDSPPDLAYQSLPDGLRTDRELKIWQTAWLRGFDAGLDRESPAFESLRQHADRYRNDSGTPHGSNAIYIHEEIDQQGLAPPCPDCGAAPPDHCKGPDGRLMHMPHPSRVRAAQVWYRQYQHRPSEMPANLPDELIPEYTACPHCNAQPGESCADACSEQKEREELHLTREATIAGLDDLVKRGILVKNQDGKYDFSDRAYAILRAAVRRKEMPAP